MPKKKTNKKITNASQLDPTKVKQAVEKFGQDKVNETLKNRGISTEPKGAPKGFEPIETQTGAPTPPAPTGPAKVDTEVKTETPTETTQVTDITAGMTETQKAVLEKEKELLEHTEEVEEKLGDDIVARREEIKETAEEKVETAEDFYTGTEELIRGAEEEISAIEEEMAGTYEKRVTRDTALLNKKKATEISLLKAQQEYQRVQNENNIIQAKQDVEVQRQQSAWAYNKLGLGFSSGIINQSQAIATQGIVKIAEIKSKMTMDEATINAKIADTEFNYTNLINENIDKYTDKMDALRKESIKRITDTKKDLLKNSFEKNNTINEIKDWARTELRSTEREHMEDVMKIKEKGLEFSRDIEQSIADHQKRELSKLDTMMSTGAIMNLSPSDIARKEQQLGLPAGTITAQFDNGITQDIRSRFDGILGKDYNIENLPTLVDEIKQEMKSGNTYSQAMENVMARELKENPDYIAKKSAKSLDERKFELDVAKFELDSQYKLGNLSLSKYKAETARIDKAKEAAGETPEVTAVKDQYQALFNKAVPKEMTVEAMKGAIDKKQQEDIISSVKKGTLSEEHFTEFYSGEMETISKGISDAKESKMEQGIKEIVEDLQRYGAKDEQIKAYLIQNGVVSANLSGIGDDEDGLYFDDKGNIKETTGYNEEIYKFTK